MTFQFTDQGHGKNTQQFSWVLLLKVQCAARCVVSLSVDLWTMLSAIKNQLVFPSSAPRGKACKEKFLFRFIRGYLVLSFMLLASEMVAYWNGWCLQKSQFALIRDYWFKGGYTQSISLGFSSDPITLPTQFRPCLIYVPFYSLYSLLIGYCCSLGGYRSISGTSNQE